MLFDPLSEPAVCRHSAGLNPQRRASPLKLSLSNYNATRDVVKSPVITLLSYNIDGIILFRKNIIPFRTVKFLRSATFRIAEPWRIIRWRSLRYGGGLDNRQAAFDMVSTMLDKTPAEKFLTGSKDDIRDEQRSSRLLRCDDAPGLAPLRINSRHLLSIWVEAATVMRLLRTRDGCACAK